MEKTKIYFTILLFLLGIYFIQKSVLTERELYENFEGLKPDDCPDALIEENNKFYLYNTKKAKIPGVNPIVFNTLEDYVEFLQFQRGKNIRCPVLHLSKVNTVQGQEMYEIKNSNQSVEDYVPETVSVTPPVQKLIDATRDDPPFNDNSYPGFDKDNMYVGLNTPLNNI